jgi:hypothetical protein
MAKVGTFAEAVAVQGMARLLQRDIHVVTSQPYSSRIGYLVNKICATNIPSENSPLLIGQIAEDHFVSLSPIVNTADNFLERQNEPTKKSDNEGQSLHEILGIEESSQKEPKEIETCRDGERMQEEISHKEEEEIEKEERENKRMLSTDKPRCSSACCLSIPFQPTDVSTISSTKRLFGTGKSSRERCFQIIWYKKHPWLHLCTSNFKAFCSVCMTTSGIKGEAAFTNEGFNNWKKATQSFTEHEQSIPHKTALYASKFNTSKQSISSKVSSHFKKVQQERRSNLMKELKAVRFLLRQGLPMRGHLDEEGNLHHLLKQCFDAYEWLDNGMYLSHDVVNEIIDIMSQNILRSVLCEIRQALFYAILADEVRDLSNREQLVLCIRWLNEDYEVFEEPMGLIQLTDSKASTILSAIQDSLVRLALPLENCRGQAYDGAAIFQGHISGVAVKIQEQEPRAISVHCLAHCLNLSLQQATRQVTAMRDALDFAMEVTQLIAFSPKRQALFEQFHDQINKSLPGIKPLCPTRWTMKTRAFASLLVNYTVLQDTLNEVAQGSDDYSRKATGLMALMQKFSTSFGLNLAHLVFGATELLSNSLQSKSTTCEDANMAVNICLRFIESHRTDEAFSELMAKAKETIGDDCDEPRVPRHQSKQFKDPAIYFRQQFFQTLDIVAEDIKMRFNQRQFTLVKNLENTITGRLTNVLEIISETYKQDINVALLETQIKLLPAALAETEKPVTVNSVVNILRQSSAVRRMLSEVDKLVRIYLTIPVTTATAERSFSVLRRLKTYLRTTMTQKRLNNCMIMHVFKSKTDSIDLMSIGQDFVDRNERRRNFFGNFK